PERSEPMKRSSLILLTVTLLPTALLAQPQRKSDQNPAEANPSAKARAMYEDIEIMRRVLIRGLGTRSIVFKLSQCTVCHTANTAFFDADRGSGVSVVETRRSAVLFNDVSQQSGVTLADVDLDGVVDLYVSNGSHPHGGMTSFSLEGSYLRGHGVVFNMTLPPLPREELAPTPPAAPTKSDSEWEQTRRQLRGESGT